MYEKRQKHYPTFPKLLDEAIDQLKNLCEDDFFSISRYLINLSMFTILKILFV